MTKKTITNLAFLGGGVVVGVVVGAVVGAAVVAMTSAAVDTPGAAASPVANCTPHVAVAVSEKVVGDGVGATVGEARRRVVFNTCICETRCVVWLLLFFHLRVQ